MTLQIEVLPSRGYPESAAARIAAALPVSGPVVITGGRSAAAVYPHLLGEDADWTHIQVLFSDERCVPPTHPESNYGMANRLLLAAAAPQRIHRMKGELPPEVAAAEYEAEIAPYVQDRIPLVLLGLGGDCHIAGIFPGSDTVGERQRLCVAVPRPDGLEGLTLTPAALLAADSIIVFTCGRSKAEAVERAVTGKERPEECPVRLLADHPEARLLIDEGAATLL